MNDISEVGLTKFDFLGLKTLTVIKNALTFIREVGTMTSISITFPLTTERLTNYSCAAIRTGSSSWKAPE